MTPRPYRLIGIDLDGTLIGPDGVVSAANRAAIGQAMDEGVAVVPCTGRGWRESRRILEDLPGLELGVFVTGAVVGEVATGRCADLAEMEPGLAAGLVRFLADEPRAVLVYRESGVAGHDYLVTGRGTLHDNTRAWFDAAGAIVHHQREVTAADLHGCLRVGMVTTARRARALRRQLDEAFGDKVLAHSFAAMHSGQAGEAIHVLEVFAGGVDKWRGLEVVARGLGVGPEQVAAIGDEVNDLAMLRKAGCGIAMANAIEPAKAAADRVTLDHAHDGVAHAIDHLLRGAW